MKSWLRWRTLRAADSIIHFLWSPGTDMPRWARWICDRYDALW